MLQVAAFIVVPEEGRGVIAQVTGEGRHIVGGVGKALFANWRAARRSLVEEQGRVLEQEPAVV